MITMSEAFRRCLEEREREEAGSAAVARRLAQTGELRTEYEIRPNGQCVQKVFLPGGSMLLRFADWVRA